MAIEKRLARRQAMIDSTKTLITEFGESGLRPELIAKSNGISRTTFYDYFASPSDLAGEILMQEFNTLRSQLNSKLENLSDVDQIIKVWVEYLLNYYTDGSHQLVTAVISEAMKSELALEIRAAHNSIYEILVDHLLIIQMEFFKFAVQLSRATIEKAAEELRNGVEKQTVYQTTTHFLTSSLKGLLSNL